MARKIKHVGLSFPRPAQRGLGVGLQSGDYLALVETLSLGLAETLRLMEIVMWFVIGVSAGRHVLS